MADKKILEIPIDDSAWQAFLSSFREYQETLGKQSEAWAGTNAGVKNLATAFDDVESTFDDLVDKATSQKFSSATDGAFARVGKDSRDTAKSWVGISKEIEKSSRGMQGLLRDGNRFSALGQLFGIGGLAAAGMGVFNAVRGADNSLADQNLLNRKLGLAPGEEKAFDNVYGPAGGDTALLNKVASAQADQSQWKAFMALGLSQNQIQSMDPAHLAAEVLKRGGEQFNQRGASAGLWANATGVSSLVDVNSMRLAGSYQGKFGDMSKDFEQLIPKLAASQKALDDATVARQKIEAAITKDETELYQALEKLNPLVIKGADAVTAWITSFAKTEDFDKDVQEVSTAFTELGTAASWVSGKLNALFGGPDPDPKKDNTVTADKDGLIANLVAAWQHPKDFLNGKVNGEGFSWDYGKAAGALINGKDGDGSAGAGGASNNPGNLEIPGKHGQFQHFDNPDQGALAMDAQLLLYAGRDHLTTLQGIISKYAPKADHNDTDAYIDDVRQRTGFGAAEALDMNDPKVRAAIESAMIHHEGTPYARQFDTKHILDLLTGKATPFTDPAALKTAQEIDKHNDPASVPDSVDRRAIAEQTQQKQPKTDQQGMSESITAVLSRKLDDLLHSVGSGAFGSIVHDSGTTAKRIDRQGGTQQAPTNVNIVVTTPAGSSTVTTLGTLAQ